MTAHFLGGIFIGLIVGISIGVRVMSEPKSKTKAPKAKKPRCPQCGEPPADGSPFCPDHWWMGYTQYRDI